MKLTFESAHELIDTPDGENIETSDFNNDGDEEVWGEPLSLTLITGWLEIIAFNVNETGLIGSKFFFLPLLLFGEYVTKLKSFNDFRAKKNLAGAGATGRGRHTDGKMPLQENE